MSQKFIKSQNKNEQSTAFGKYYAMAVYDNHFIGTEELADFIQRQASVKKNMTIGRTVDHRPRFRSNYL